MKIIARDSVFETNSSSCHSIVLRKTNLDSSELKMDRHGKVHAKYGDYGNHDCLDTQQEKLDYIVTHLAYSDDWEREECIENIEAYLKDYIPGCTGLVIDGNYGDAQLNHQLIGCLYEVVDVWNKNSVLNFIFDNNVMLNIWRD